MVSGDSPSDVGVTRKPAPLVARPTSKSDRSR